MLLAVFPGPVHLLLRLLSPVQHNQGTAAREVLPLCPYQENTSSYQPNAHTLIFCSRDAFAAAEGSRDLPSVSQDGCDYFPDHRDPKGISIICPDGGLSKKWKKKTILAILSSTSCVK